MRAKVKHHAGMKAMVEYHACPERVKGKEKFTY